MKVYQLQWFNNPLEVYHIKHTVPAKRPNEHQIKIVIQFSTVLYSVCIILLYSTKEDISKLFIHDSKKMPLGYR